MLYCVIELAHEDIWPWSFYCGKIFNSYFFVTDCKVILVFYFHREGFLGYPIYYIMGKRSYFPTYEVCFLFPIENHSSSTCHSYPYESMLTSYWGNWNLKKSKLTCEWSNKRCNNRAHVSWLWSIVLCPSDCLM